MSSFFIQGQHWSTKCHVNIKRQAKASEIRRLARHVVYVVCIPVARSPLEGLVYTSYLILMGSTASGSAFRWRECVGPQGTKQKTGHTGDHCSNRTCYMSTPCGCQLFHDDQHHIPFISIP